MAKGLIKYVMLKAISEGESTGYQLIKRLETITDHKPSTGTIYPMLKKMEKDGWIKGRTEGDKTFYKIIKRGKEQLKELDMLKMDHMMKIHQSISLARETFRDSGPLMVMVHDEAMRVLAPLLTEVGILLQRGKEPKRIEKIITNAVKEMKKLEKGDTDE